LNCVSLFINAMKIDSTVPYCILFVNPLDARGTDVNVLRSLQVGRSLVQRQGYLRE
jgi:hypothetical protein